VSFRPAGEEERKLIEEALRQGKLVVVTGLKDAKVSIEPKDKVLVIVRR